MEFTVINETFAEGVTQKFSVSNGYHGAAVLSIVGQESFIISKFINRTFYLSIIFITNLKCRGVTIEAKIICFNLNQSIKFVDKVFKSAVDKFELRR